MAGPADFVGVIVIIGVVAGIGYAVRAGWQRRTHGRGYKFPRLGRGRVKVTGKKIKGIDKEVEKLGVFFILGDEEKSAEKALKKVKKRLLKRINGIKDASEAKKDLEEFIQKESRYARSYLLNYRDYSTERRVYRLKGGRFKRGRTVWLNPFLVAAAGHYRKIDVYNQIYNEKYSNTPPSENINNQIKEAKKGIVVIREEVIKTKKEELIKLESSKPGKQKTLKEYQKAKEELEELKKKEKEAPRVEPV